MPGTGRWMNVPFTLAKPDLDKTFCDEAKKAGLVNLEGHRSVGGMRASIYNAMPPEGVDALIAAAVRAGIVPRGPRRVARNFRHIERLVDVPWVEPACQLRVDGVGAGQAIRLLLDFDRWHFAGTIRHDAKIEAKLRLDVVSPLMGDDDHPGKVADPLLDE